MRDVVGRAGWAGFLGWAMTGAIASLAIAAAPSFGILLLPVAVAVAILVARRVRVWPEALGALEGAAAVALLVGFLNLGHTPCRSGVVTYGLGQDVQCGGVAPGPFLIAGGALAITGVVAYARLRMRA
jgi:hypothetical protein